MRAVYYSLQASEANNHCPYQCNFIYYCHLAKSSLGYMTSQSNDSILEYNEFDRENQTDIQV